MKTKLLTATLALIFMMSCSTDNTENQTITIDESVPAIANLTAYIPNSKFDNTSTGKYVGIFGHNSNSELHGKIYVNAGLDTRYNAIIQLVTGETAKFTGVQHSRSSHTIYFQGDLGSFDIDFSDYNNPEATNVLLRGEETAGYIVLAKSRRGSDPFVQLGNYVDSNDPSFFGNWDLMGDPNTTTGTPFTITEGVPFPIDGTAVTQEIITISISHLVSGDPIIVNTPEDFDDNASAACAPLGVVLPTTEPVLIDIIIPVAGGYVGAAVSAGGQTSTINGSISTWSFNYNTDIANGSFPEGYTSDTCQSTTSGTWSWNGRSGTSTAGLLTGF